MIVITTEAITIPAIVCMVKVGLVSIAAAGLFSTILTSC